MACWPRYTEPRRADSAGDPDVTCIPALHGFDIDLRAVVTPEASISLRGGDLIIGPAFGPILAVVDFVRIALQGRLAVILSDSAVIAADRLIARLRAHESLAVGALAA